MPIGLKLSEGNMENMVDLGLSCEKINAVHGEEVARVRECGGRRVKRRILEIREGRQRTLPTLPVYGSLLLHSPSFSDSSLSPQTFIRMGKLRNSLQQMNEFTPLITFFCDADNSLETILI
ncbi:hypothetical protein KC19_1G233700 [Ceratodon purpureus]|uniref:Uncharacterized protein n=1 Tax=Ceratodon purpureus TaxID=3225 RepID=A0A8T0J8G7_CERPU|nr:hypothetical protein KC19_1G233700 [Ceratodon purpureus]